MDYQKGFDHTLDHLRELVEDSSQAIMKMEREEQEKTGIQSLKIRYNQVHGYYIEVTKTNSAFVPTIMYVSRRSWQRTVHNCCAPAAAIRNYVSSGPD